MGLDARILADNIASALKNNVSVGGNVVTDNTTAESFIDNSIQKMAKAIADEVVKHIQDNLEVESLGTGYNGFQVKSNSIDVS
ncbi:hypothetical protein [Tenacibaculum sp. 190524A05c]|uniref:hypothetical protein n=1 Tax=Tenacibaculum platacis TaxID=3137852 RepID=UPI0032B28601